MNKTVQIGNKQIGDNQPVFIIAEIGINHNGSLSTAKNLIDMAARCGCDAVKFQKRSVEIVYTTDELSTPRESPFGKTNGDLKRGLEFGIEQYTEIDRYCKEKNILWFASPWDEQSVDFLEQFDPICYKIASASLTDDELLKHIRSKDRPIILSTGMSNMPMIEHAVDILGKNELVLMHCTSVYPTRIEEGDHGLSSLNLAGITTLKQFGIPVGFSSHDTGIIPTYASVVLGACAIEKHITLYRAMWGSDQTASIEPHDLERLCRMVREFRLAKGDGIIRIYPEEIPIMKKLRRKYGVWNLDQIKTEVLSKTE